MLDVREFLGSYQQAIRDAARIAEQAEQLRTRMTRITAAYGEEKGGRGQSVGFADLMPQLCDLLDNLNAKTKAALDRASAVSETISRVESPLLRETLELRYLSGLTWEEAAEKMNRSVRWYADEIKIAEKEIEPYVIQNQLFREHVSPAPKL